MPERVIDFALEELPHKISDHFMTDLAGNMFSGGTYAACFIAAMVYGPDSELIGAQAVAGDQSVDAIIVFRDAHGDTRFA